ncbi:MAG: serine--tRNA ligase, partial [Pyrinomonadaceae bacterium]
MLDLHFVRENLEKVRQALVNRNFPTESLEKFSELDAERRRVIAEADSLNAQRNRASKEIGELIKQGKREEAEEKKKQVAELKERQAELEQKRNEVESAMQALLASLPNIPSEDVPIGKDETANVEIRRWGEPRSFTFQPKDHVELGESLGILDLERASKIAGARFAILTG